MSKAINNHDLPPGIALTAILVALLRANTSIPFSIEIAQKLGGIGENDFANRFAAEHWLKPFVETRYAALHELLHHHKPDWVLDVGAGLSPRGINYATTFKSARYVEADCAEILQLKETIINTVSRAPNNLASLPFDALAQSSWREADRTLPAHGLGVILIEGLLQYLARSETARVLTFARELLSRRSGLILSSDFPTVHYYDVFMSTFPRAAELNNERTKLTGINIYANAFLDDSDVEILAAGTGWGVLRHRQMDLVRNWPNLIPPHNSFRNHLTVYELKPISMVEKPR